jgi:hypothetical protein
MGIGRSFSRRTIGALVVAGVLAGGTYAFTASNTVPASTAGSGSGTISGYTISSIAYTLDSTTPTNLNAVTFTISPTTASQVKAQLASGGSWYTCTNTSGSVSCTTTSPQATVAAATNLTVVATQ